jgi:hypothetical protein
MDLGQLAGQDDQEYQDFVRLTGIHAEHDLDRIAASYGDPSDQNAISAVFTGSFDEARLSAYLKDSSNGTEAYAGKTIFLARRNAPTLRVCILDRRTVVIAISESSDPMHHMIDASRASSPPAPLIDGYFHHVPLGSSAWLVYRGGSGAIFLPILQNSTSVVSLRYTGSLRVQARVISAGEAQAAGFARALREYIPVLVGYLQRGQVDADVLTVLKTIEIQQHGNETVVNAVIPERTVAKLAKRNFGR